MSRHICVTEISNQIEMGHFSNHADPTNMARQHPRESIMADAAAIDGAFVACTPCTFAGAEEEIIFDNSEMPCVEPLNSGDAQPAVSKAGALPFETAGDVGAEMFEASGRVSGDSGVNMDTSLLPPLAGAAPLLHDDWVPNEHVLDPALLESGRAADGRRSADGSWDEAAAMYTSGGDSDGTDRSLDGLWEGSCDARMLGFEDLFEGDLVGLPAAGSAGPAAGETDHARGAPVAAAPRATPHRKRTFEMTATQLQRVRETNRIMARRNRAKTRRAKEGLSRRLRDLTDSLARLRQAADVYRARRAKLVALVREAVREAADCPEALRRIVGTAISTAARPRLT